MLSPAVDGFSAKYPSGMRDRVKPLNLGLMLMNVIGRRVMAIAVRAMGERIRG